MPAMVSPLRFGSPIARHRYWEVFSIGGQTVNPAFGEWEFAATPGGADMTVAGSGSTTGQVYGYFSGISNPQNMIDNNVSAASVATHSTGQPNYGAAWRQDFGAPVSVAEIRLASRDAGTLVTTPWAFFIRGSDDLVDWTTYVIEDNAGWPLDGVVTKSWLIGAPMPKTGRGNARAWRAYITEVDGSTTRASLGGLAFAATPGGPSLTALPSGSPLTGYGTIGSAFCSAAGGTNWLLGNPERAFDGDSATYWFDNRASDVFVGMLFPAAQDISEVRLTACSNTALMALNTAPRAGRIEYTTDFNTWVTAATFSGLSFWSAGQTRAVAVP